MSESATPIADGNGLDAARIGEICVRLPYIARQLGHTKPLHTCDYLPDNEPELLLVKRLLQGKRTEEFFSEEVS